MFGLNYFFHIKLYGEANKGAVENILVNIYHKPVPFTHFVRFLEIFFNYFVCFILVIDLPTAMANVCCSLIPCEKRTGTIEINCSAPPSIVGNLSKMLCGIGTMI